MSKLDNWLDKHERLDNLYTEYCIRKNVWTRRLNVKRRIQDSKWRRQFKPGGFYLDHGHEPMILIELDQWDSLRGISLVDGREVHSDLYHCGPEPVTEKEAKAKIEEVRAEKADPNYGKVDWDILQEPGEFE